MSTSSGPAPQIKHSPKLAKHSQTPNEDEGEGGINLVVGKDVDFQFASADESSSAKKKKKKKKKKSKTGSQGSDNPNNQNGDNSSKSAGKKSKDDIWDISREEELQRLREFWNGLNESERRKMIEDEKESALKRIRENEKRSCSCSGCVRKREAIEEELDYLYGRYFKQLDKVPTISISTRHHQIKDTKEPEATQDTIREDLSGDEDYDDEYDYDNSTPHDLYHHDHSKHREIDLFDFRALSGGLLSVADDLLQNQGKRFITMMEKLAEEKIARDQEELVEKRVNAFYENDPDNPKDGDKDGDEDTEAESSKEANENSNGGSWKSIEVEEDSNGFEVKEGYNAEVYDSEPQEYYDDDDYLDDDDDAEYDDDDEAPLSKEERILENREVLQFYAAQLFEQRVLTAYRESIARERQKKLLEELEEEKRLEEEKEKKRLLDKEKKKDKKRQQKLAKEEEKARKEAEKKLQEEALRLEREKKNEEARLRKLEQKQKKDAEKQKRAEEERKRRHEEEKRKEERRRQEEEKRLQNEELRKQKQMKRLEEERRAAEETARKLALQHEAEQKKKQEEAAASAANSALKLQQEQMMKQNLKQNLQKNSVAEPVIMSPIPSTRMPVSSLSSNSSPLIGSGIGSGRHTPINGVGSGVVNGTTNGNGSTLLQGLPAFGQQPLGSPLGSLNSGPFTPLQQGGIPRGFPSPLNNNSSRTAILRNTLEEDNPIDELNRMMTNGLNMNTQMNSGINTGLNSGLNSGMNMPSMPMGEYAPIMSSGLSSGNATGPVAEQHAPMSASIPPTSSANTTSSALENFSPLFGTRNSLMSDTLWSSNNGSSLWGSAGTSPAQNDATIRRHAIRAYQMLVQEGWSSPDGYISTPVLYQKTMKLMGKGPELNQTEFHKACGVFDSMYSDRFESLRDSMGIITHLKYSPQGREVKSQGTPWPMMQGVL